MNNITNSYNDIINEIISENVSIEIYDNGIIRFVMDGDCPEFPNEAAARRYINEYKLTGDHLNRCKRAYDDDLRNNDAGEYWWHLLSIEAEENLAIALG